MTHPLHTRLCDLLGIRVPIVQTGMGWVATPELAAAASNAGAFGFLAAATIPPPEVEAAIARVQSLTDRPFGVNFLMDAPGADVISAAIIRRGVRAAGYNRSPDPKLITRLKQAGVLCIPTCGAPRHVEKAVELGADAVIVQGAEGGGHTGSIPTSLLVPACVERVDAPIIAAGGFKDGRGLVAALAWGAAGIAMGTRFLLTAESPVPAATIERYLAAGLGDVVVSSEIDGLPQRMIVNELLRKLESAGPLAKLWLAFRNAVELRASTGASPLALLRTALALRRNERLTRAQLVMAANAPILAKRAMLDGDPVHGYLPSGTVTGVIDDRPTCAALIERIMNEAEQTLKRLQVQAPQSGARSEAEPSGVEQLATPGRKEAGPSSPSVPL